MRKCRKVRRNNGWMEKGNDKWIEEKGMRDVKKKNDAWIKERRRN